MEIQEDGTRVYAQFAVFSSDLQDSDSDRFLIIFYQTNKLISNKDDVSYKIRKMSNFNVNLYADELSFGNQLKLKNQKLTIDLIYL